MSVDSLIRGQLLSQLLLAEHVPHRPKLSDELRVEALSRHRCILEALPRIWRLTTILAQIVKVGVFSHQRVTPNLLQCDSVIWVCLEHALNQVFGLAAESLRHLIHALLGLAHHNAQVRIIKRESSG